VRDEDAARNLAVDRYDNMRKLQEQPVVTHNPVLPDMQSPVAPPP
jgi:hypothetical protein